MNRIKEILYKINIHHFNLGELIQVKIPCRTSTNLIYGRVPDKNVYNSNHSMKRSYKIYYLKTNK